MIIKFGPHGFVVFLTIAMGMVYALTHSRSQWGFWKLAMAGIVVFFLYNGVLIGRIVEVFLGALIGWVYARGGLRLPGLNPFASIGNYFRNRQAHRAAKKAEREQKRTNKRTGRNGASGSSRSSHNREEEAQRRKERAKAQRERANAQEDVSGSNSRGSQSNSGNSGPGSSQSYEKRPQQEPKRSVDNRTSYEILGVSRDATPAQIKKAYGMLRSRYHPDKYEHMSATFKREAADEFKKVQKAWEALR